MSQRAPNEGVWPKQKQFFSHLVGSSVWWYNTYYIKMINLWLFYLAFYIPLFSLGKSMTLIIGVSSIMYLNLHKLLIFQNDCEHLGNLEWQTNSKKLMVNNNHKSKLLRHEKLAHTEKI